MGAAGSSPVAASSVLSFYFLLQAPWTVAKATATATASRAAASRNAQRRRRDRTQRRGAGTAAARRRCRDADGDTATATAAALSSPLLSSVPLLPSFPSLRARTCERRWHYAARAVAVGRLRRRRQQQQQQQQQHQHQLPPPSSLLPPPSSLPQATRAGQDRQILSSHAPHPPGAMTRLRVLRER